MRKLFVTVAAIVLALVFSVTAFGCNLIETDSEKDMKQVVATVQIEEGAPKDEILKQDIVMAYLNYGYQYEQQYGYTREQTIKLIVDSLISNRVYLQTAILKFESTDAIFAIEKDTSKDKWDVERYLSAEEIIEATYSAKKDINNLIDNYMEEDGEKVKDTYTEEVRAIPTGAVNAEDEEPTIDEKKVYEIDVDSTPERKKAYSKVIDLLEVNSLLGEYKNTAKITDSEYYVETLKGYKEQAIIDKYTKCLTDSVHAKFGLDDVKAAYAEKLAEQKKWTDTDYATALGAVSATAPILYAPTGTYGFVYNLLLGASEDQTKELTDWKEDKKNYTNADLATARREILASTVVKDQRSSWILSGYDFDGKQFTGDYAVAGENSLQFYGKVNLLNEDEKENDDYKAEYNVSETTELSLDKFIEEMEKYVYGEVKTDKETYEANPTYNDASVYRSFSSSEPITNYKEKINELLFAFSTDPGSLNTYKGYLISPEPDGANAETYMQEFADYGRKVVNGEVGTNGYIMVATDYGYHVMFYSEKYVAGFEYADLETYLNKECADLKGEFADWAAVLKDMQDNWDGYENTDNYLYTLYSSLVSTKISDIINKDYNDMINEYVYGGNSAVVKYEDRYADLLEG
ncbi:MAG: hypothetical protein E7346_00235 [Clostridiales bacterium]|nr:hypothetical protein [Clostridiales bacterium]